MDAHSTYRLEFWINEFKADPKETGFQLFLNQRNDSFDEVISEEESALYDAGLRISDINTLLESRVILVKNIATGGGFDGNEYSDRAYYYFDQMQTPS